MIVVQGSATSVDLPEWLIQKLDVPAKGGAFTRQNDTSLNRHDASYGAGGAVQVFYLDPAISRQRNLDLWSKIQATISKRSFLMTSPPTITVRGTPADLAQAQQIIDSR